MCLRFDRPFPSWRRQCRDGSPYDVTASMGNQGHRHSCSHVAMVGSNCRRCMQTGLPTRGRLPFDCQTNVHNHPLVLDVHDRDFAHWKHLCNDSTAVNPGFAVASPRANPRARPSITSRTCTSRQPQLSGVAARLPQVPALPPLRADVREAGKGAEGRPQHPGDAPGERLLTSHPKHGPHHVSASLPSAEFMCPTKSHIVALPPVWP